MSGLVDVHTHIGVDLGDGSTQTAAELLAVLPSAGVSRVVVSTFEGGPQVGEGNAEVMRAAAAAPETLIPFVVYVPTESPTVRARFPAMLRDWAVAPVPVQGVVINPTMHPCDLGHPQVRAVIDLCSELGLSVMLHYMAQWSDSAEGGAALAKEYPAVRFLVPGIAWIPGGLGLFGDLGNVFVDTTRSYGRMTVSSLISAVGPERVLFGSDSPRLDMAHEAAKLSASGLTDTQLRAVRSGNASRLFDGA